MQNAAPQCIGEGQNSDHLEFVRAFSIHLLPWKICARWLFLKEKATRLRGFCKYQNRKCRSWLFAAGAPEGAYAQVAEESGHYGGDQEALVLRPGEITGMGAPQVLGEVEGEESEEKSGDFKPENSAHAAEGAEETAHAASGDAAEAARLGAVSAHLGRRPGSFHGYSAGGLGSALR